MVKYWSAGALAIMVGVVVGQWWTAPVVLTTSYEFEQERMLSPFELIDQDGEPLTNQALLGKWSLLYVGYTSCPDICPAATAKLTSVTRTLREEAPFQTIFISVDPQRDTSARLKDYMQFFKTEFIAATAEHSQLLPLTRELGFAYAMVGSGENYQVDHSASLVLVSPRGQRIAVVKPKVLTPGRLPQIHNQELINDIRALIGKHG